MNCDGSTDIGRKRWWWRWCEVRAQLDEKPSDEDGEDEQQRGGAEYRCLQRWLVLVVWVTRRSDARPEQPQ